MNFITFLGILIWICNSGEETVAEVCQGFLEVQVIADSKDFTCYISELGQDELVSISLLNHLIHSFGLNSR